MPHPSYAETSTGRISPLTIGSGHTAVTVGGAATLPSCPFDGDPGHPPAIALEIADLPPAPIPPALAEAFGDTLADPLARLERGLSLCRPDALLLRLTGSHPDAGGRTPAQEAALVERVANAAGLPLIVVGSGHLEADVALFKEVAEVLRGTDSLIGKAQERNYRSFAAIARAAGLPLIALTDLDVNLCKQLNILLTQAGFPNDRIVIDPMASAVGYGFEYTYSVVERIRLAALRQGDQVLRCPVLLDLGEVVGKTKEVQVPEVEAPGWGPAGERYLDNEALAAAVYLLAGADIVAVRDPRTVTALKDHRDAMIGGGALMALSGIEIYKLLPRTNCRDCGFPTCLAFAMKVAAHQAAPQDCPHISPDALGALLEAATAPVVEVALGVPPGTITVGGETELHRHQKTFFHSPAIFPLVGDDDPAAIDRAAAIVQGTVFERVGERLAFAGAALESRAGSAKTFSGAALRLAAGVPGPIALIADDPAILGAGARAVAARRPILVAATAGTLDALLPLAREISSPLALTAPDLDSLLALSEIARAAGGKDLLLLPPGGAAGFPSASTALRRLAVTARHRPAGYPVVCRAGRGIEGLLAAGAGVARYAGVILWEEPTPAEALALFTLRQNIYTDPQRPMKVEEAVHAIGNPGPDSPLLITTNFSLTYFLVSGEVANSGVPTHLAVMDADGLSVLTAWAAGKFVADRIVEFLKRSGALDKVAHKKVVIPGYVASLAGEMEDLLGPGSVVIGPREATGLPAFLKSWR